MSANKDNQLIWEVYASDDKSSTDLSQLVTLLPFPPHVTKNGWYFYSREHVRTKFDQIVTVKGVIVSREDAGSAQQHLLAAEDLFANP